MIFALGGTLFFGLAKAISRQRAVLSDHQALIIDFTDVPSIASSMAIEDIIKDDLKAKKPVFITGANAAVVDRLQRLGLLQELPADALVKDRSTALQMATQMLKSSGVLSVNTPSIGLRTYVYCDSLQPQIAAYMATVSQGFLPIPGDACLWVEVAPGMAVHQLTDVALKATRVHLAQQVVERAYGSMIHQRDQSDVREAGNILLARMGAQVSDRTHPSIAWQETIRGMTPDHTVLINRQDRRGSMILPGKACLF